METILTVTAGANSHGPFYPDGGDALGYQDGATNGDNSCGAVTPNPAHLASAQVSAITAMGADTPTFPDHTFIIALYGVLDQNAIGVTTFTDQFGSPLTFDPADATFTTTDKPGFSIWTWSTGADYAFTYGGEYSITVQDGSGGGGGGGGGSGGDGSGFNCDCDAVSPWDTLANLRTRMLIRLGYPNQIANPPPGMAALIDEFLRSAQKEIYRQVQRAGRRTERFFKWTMVPQQRFYGIADEELACAVLDVEKITWVGFEDLNKAWYRLDDGIPPEYYTRANINFGWPTRYEIRSCIEIFPAPQAAYTLWIKGDFDLAPLVADTDRCTIDDEAVFLLALGNAKSDRGQKDSQLVLTQAGNYIKGVVAGAHGTKRYVPRSQSENPLTPPRFIPLGGGQS